MRVSVRVLTHTAIRKEAIPQWSRGAWARRAKVFGWVRVASSSAEAESCSAWSKVVGAFPERFH